MVSEAPTRAPGTTPMVSSAASRQSMSPRNAWVMVAGTAKIPTQTSEVAIADLSDIDSSSVNAGTMITPPPIPSSPDNNPATTPIPAALHRNRRGPSRPADRAPASLGPAARPRRGLVGRGLGRVTAVRQAVKARRTAMRSRRR